VRDLQKALDDKAAKTALDGKANTVHTHAIADVTDLQKALDDKAAKTALDGKANTVHTHAIADVSQLQKALDDKAAKTALDGKAAISHNHPISDITGLQAALNTSSAIAFTSATLNTLFPNQSTLTATVPDGYVKEDCIFIWSVPNSQGGMFFSRKHTFKAEPMDNGGSGHDSVEYKVYVAVLAIASKDLVVVDA
jgi:hypothetical protein